MWSFLAASSCGHSITGEDCTDDVPLARLRYTAMHLTSFNMNCTAEHIFSLNILALHGGQQHRRGQLSAVQLGQLLR